MFRDIASNLFLSRYRQTNKVMEKRSLLCISNPLQVHGRCEESSLFSQIHRVWCCERLIRSFPYSGHQRGKSGADMKVAVSAFEDDAPNALASAI